MKASGSADGKTAGASRLRLALLAATVFVAAPLAAAEPTLVIDSAGHTYLIGDAGAAPMPPRRAGISATRGPVSLDLSVLDRLDQAPPEGRRGPLRLKQPSRLIADAERIQTYGSVTVFPDAVPRRPNWLKPPKELAVKPIKLRPPRRSRSARPQVAARSPVVIPLLARLPPRRDGGVEPIAPPTPQTLATLPPPPPTAASLRRPQDRRLVAAAPPVTPQRTANGLLDISPIRPGERLAAAPAPQAEITLAKAPPAATALAETKSVASPAPKADAPVPAAEASVQTASLRFPPRRPAAAHDAVRLPRAEPRRATRTELAMAPLPPIRPNLNDPIAPAAVDPAARAAPPSQTHGIDRRKTFPIADDSQAPPAMAQPGWHSAAPAAADRAARQVNDLPALASLAPPPDRDPAPIAGSPDRALLDPGPTAEPTAGVTRPGSAVLAPPPPPARAIQNAAALPEPPVETPTDPPRRPLAIPQNLARVTPPSDPDSATSLTVLTPPSAREAAAEPRFAPAPAGALDALDQLQAAAPATAPAAPETPPKPAPEAPEQLALPLGPPKQEAPAIASSAHQADAAPLQTEIAFAAASRSLPKNAEPALSQIVARLKADPALRVRLAGAASAEQSKRARDLALARALAVQRYLVSQGVLSEAIRVEPVSGAPDRDAVAVRLIEPA